MFTGIITAVTKIKNAHNTDGGLLITFEKPSGWEDLELGESIATNGVCLTVTEIRKNEYDCFLMPETLAKSSFGKTLPEKVNLERSLAIGERLSGHLVQGHVDTTSQVLEIKTSKDYEVWIGLADNFKNLVVPKGSVGVNGVSLTVSNLAAGKFSVSLIPHTLEHTTLKSLKIGDLVNLEFDIIGKYMLRNNESRRS